MPYPKVTLTFTDDAGAVWDVYDVAFGPPLAGPHHRKRLDYGDPRARYRLFVPPDPDPMIRSYDFKRGWGRGITTNVLGAQLRAAAYSPKRRTAPAKAPPEPPLGQ